MRLDVYQTQVSNVGVSHNSDGVLNPGGVRFGSGEIYTVLETFSVSIDDSLCIGQRRPQDKDERVLLFLKMRPGHKFTPELVLDIKTSIRKGLSTRHVPSYIFEVSDIPVRLFTLLHMQLFNFLFPVHCEWQEDRNRC